jgi:hypothetical protein
MGLGEIHEVGDDLERIVTLVHLWPQQRLAKAILSHRSRASSTCRSRRSTPV